MAASGTFQAQGHDVHELVVQAHPLGAQRATLQALAREGVQRPWLGTWSIEYGPLNRVVGLRSTAGDEDRSEDAGIDWLDAARVQRRLMACRPLRRELFVAPLLELRSYATVSGRGGEFVGAMLEALPFRERYSPCVGLWTSRERGWDLAVHLWAYDSLAARAAARDGAMADADWGAYRQRIPPLLHAMQALLLVPMQLPAAGGAG